MSLADSSDFKGQWKKVGEMQMQRHQRKQSSLGNESSRQRRQADGEKTADEIEMHKNIQEMRQRIYVLAENNSERIGQNSYPLHSY